MKLLVFLLTICENVKVYVSVLRLFDRYPNGLKGLLGRFPGSGRARWLPAGESCSDYPQCSVIVQVQKDVPVDALGNEINQQQVICPAN